MLFVLTKKHEPFYSKELEMVPAHQKVIQPMNRGTLPAILWSLLRVSRLDNQAVVTFFPSDHHFVDERKFMAAVEWAFSLCRGTHRIRHPAWCVAREGGDRIRLDRTRISQGTRDRRSD